MKWQFLAVNELVLAIFWGNNGIAAIGVVS